MTTPRTAAGRALWEAEWNKVGAVGLRDHILAIEAEAAAPYRDALATLVAAHDGADATVGPVTETTVLPEFMDALAAARRLIEVGS